MKETSRYTKDIIEKTMACTAFAEAGVKCPLDLSGDEHSRLQRKAQRKSMLKAMEDDMTCCTFAEAGENCPVVM